MSIAFLNGSYLPLEEAKISPMDRGFLFGDSIYEVIPAYEGKLIGFGLHIDRMKRGLHLIGNELCWSLEQWWEVCQHLIEMNGRGNLGIYLQVSRGVDSKRFHSYSADIEPTIFAFSFEINSSRNANQTSVIGYRVSTSLDMRWKCCHIKSTSLLGNVMHFQYSYAKGNDETLLYNTSDELTEGSASNAYIVKYSTVITPPLDDQVLPGITLHILIDLLKKEGSIKVVERALTMDELRHADEVWLTSSTKEVVPVIEVDGEPVSDGRPGNVWKFAHKLYHAGKHKY